MFKKAMILVFGLLLCSGVFSIRLIDPISKELSLDNEFVGSVSKGNTLELIFSKELVSPYSDIALVNSLPLGFSYDVKYEKESIKLFISVPKGASVGDYPLVVRLFNDFRDDTASIYFSVVSGALDVSPSSAVGNVVFVDSLAEYNFFFVNNSDASAVFSISTSLPANWNQDNAFASRQVSKSVIVPRRQSLESSIVVYPRMQGKKEFFVRVYFEDSFKDFSFFIEGKPTLKGKLGASLFGLPFYSFSMLPSYFFNGIASFWAN